MSGADEPEASPRDLLPDPVRAGRGAFELGAQVGRLRDGAASGQGFVGASLGWSPGPGVGIELRGAMFPRLDSVRWSGSTLLATEPEELVQVARTTGVGSAELVFAPIFGTLATDRWTLPVELRVAAGVGGVSTVEDLDLLETTGSARLLATRSELHLGPTWGAGLRVGGAIALRFDLRATAYVETIDSVVLVTRTPTLLSGGINVSPPSGP